MLPSKDDREDGSRPPGLPLGPHRDRPPVLMMARSLDFTIEPGRTYRYRGTGSASSILTTIEKSPAIVS